MNFSSTEKQILAGLFLSKFDAGALEILGFSTFIQAFNILGYSLGGSPASIKNYRDEFDPYFPNARRGWHNRPMKNYCKTIFDKFKDLEFNSFAELIESFLNPNFKLEKEIDRISRQAKVYNPMQRIATGLAAEEYFIANYKKYFQNFLLNDTRNLACGFDFKMNLNTDYFCIEVKGLNEKSGNFLMTQKEYDVASELEEKYCLFIVSNFKEKPAEKLIYNPVKNYELKKLSSTIVQINYQGSI